MLSSVTASLRVQSPGLGRAEALSAARAIRGAGAQADANAFAAASGRVHPPPALPPGLLPMPTMPTTLPQVEGGNGNTRRRASLKRRRTDEEPPDDGVAGCGDEDGVVSEGEEADGDAGDAEEALPRKATDTERSARRRESAALYNEQRAALAASLADFDARHPDATKSSVMAMCAERGLPAGWGTVDRMKRSIIEHDEQAAADALADSSGSTGRAMAMQRDDGGAAAAHGGSAGAHDETDT